MKDSYNGVEVPRGGAAIEYVLPFVRIFDRGDFTEKNPTLCTKRKGWGTRKGLACAVFGNDQDGAG